jgi:tol-pal system protein YbgF
LSVWAVIVAAAGTVFGPSVGKSDPASGGGFEVAQTYGVPPANVGDDSDGPSVGRGGDSASLVVRVGQLEEQIRQLNGKIEQLQFANRQLEDQMRKFQEDVEFRFQEMSKKGGIKLTPKRSDLSSPTPASSAVDADSPSAVATATPHVGSRDDAFDPTKNPNAPGAPRILGAVGPQAGATAGAANSGIASTDDAPITLLSSPQQSGNLSPGAASQTNPMTSTTGGVAPARPGTSTAGLTTPAGTVIADTNGDVTKEEFDIALGYLKQKDYENAERSFATFIAKNPKNRRTSDALYYLGETYYLRGRQREAAEQYLKISTNYATSPRAPEAMLRLGEALHALGAKEQACATFGEVPRKYPNASAAIKAGAEREAKRAQC